MTEQDEWKSMIADCEARESRLTEWEIGFIDSINYRLNKDRPLSEMQVHTLEKIWDRVTAKG